MIERPIWPLLDLEIRRRGGGREIRGRFPYNRTATLRDRGRVRKERFRSRAFRFAVESEREINLLAGHSFKTPLASRRAGTLVLADGEDELSFRATLPPDAAQPTWMRDTVLALEAGLIQGISPGFNVPPSNVVPDAESLIPEAGNPGVMIRDIREAVLYELSLVSRPAYEETSVEVRAENLRVLEVPVWL